MNLMEIPKTIAPALVDHLVKHGLLPSSSSGDTTHSPLCLLQEAIRTARDEISEFEPIDVLTKNTTNSNSSSISFWINDPIFLAHATACYYQPVLDYYYDHGLITAQFLNCALARAAYNGDVALLVGLAQFSDSTLLDYNLLLAIASAGNHLPMLEHLLYSHNNYNPELLSVLNQRSSLPAFLLAKILEQLWTHERLLRECISRLTPQQKVAVNTWWSQRRSSLILPRV